MDKDVRLLLELTKIRNEKESKQREDEADADALLGIVISVGSIIAMAVFIIGMIIYAQLN